MGRNAGVRLSSGPKGSRAGEESPPRPGEPVEVHMAVRGGRGFQLWLRAGSGEGVVDFAALREFEGGDEPGLRRQPSRDAAS